MKKFLDDAANQNHPLRALRIFWIRKNLSKRLSCMIKEDLWVMSWKSVMVKYP